MNGFIYKITNDINDKVYIGKTLSSIEKRFQEHKHDSTRGRMEKRPLYNAMNKYGCEHFQVELVEEAPIEELSDREKYWIEYYGSFKNGYNATIGGEGTQLYDYDMIVKGFLSGKLIEELAEEFECCKDTIANALNLANIDTHLNAYKKSIKGIIAEDFSGNVIQVFSSHSEAAKWLQDNGYSKGTDRDNIVAAIGRVANGKRKSAYGMNWKNIEQC